MRRGEALAAPVLPRTERLSFCLFSLCFLFLELAA